MDIWENTNETKRVVVKCRVFVQRVNFVPETLKGLEFYFKHS